MDLGSLPKIELHLHLDCSLSYDAVSQLAPSVTRAEYERDYIAPARCTNLTDFLTRAPKGYRLMQSEDALRLVTDDVFSQLGQDNIIYAELRFAPLLHTENGLSPCRVVEIVERAADECARQTGIEARLILCTLRHFTEAQSLATAQLAVDFRGSRVTAIDLAADEAGFPISAHVSAYRYAREHDVYRTAHAGEARGPESVWETLRALEPTRIGHGVRSMEDPNLVDHLRRERIHLELCPSSNAQIVPSIASFHEHPIDRLYRAGVSLTVNTDTRMLNPITLSGEYERMQQVFGWTEQDFFGTNLMGIEAAFAPEEVRQAITMRLRSGYGVLDVETSPLPRPAERL